ncbi:hypothetical protein ON010_g12182 [Phytophthora cinnamomi]|nr:hypothetical protein ON010_g12182 [Phytophthora cinnamomi]
MVHDGAHNMYVPCFWVLRESKDHWSYKHILRWVKIQCRMKCKPKAVVCAFEQDLHVAVKGQFGDSYLIVCLFHWKQAIRRKLIALRIPADDIKKVMAPGCLDVLTVVPEKQSDIRMKRADPPNHSAVIEYPAVPRFR